MGGIAAEQLLPDNQEKEGEKIKLDTTISFVHHCYKEFIAFKPSKLINSVLYLGTAFAMCCI